MDKDFERALRSWPTGAVDKREPALAAWQELSDEERVEAATKIKLYVEAHKAARRTVFCSFATFLRERPWESFSTELQRPQGAKCPTKPTLLVKTPPTAFQLANPHMFPDKFNAGEPGGRDVPK